MHRRLIFPIMMFVLAGFSFAYGTWQWLTARSIQASANQQVAYILDTVERMPWSERQKQTLYVAIFDGYPKSPSIFGLDVSGSLAAPSDDDQCANAGQQAVCRAIRSASVSEEVIWSVCGVCNPLAP